MAITESWPREFGVAADQTVVCGKVGKATLEAEQRLLGVAGVLVVRYKAEIGGAVKTFPESIMTLTSLSAFSISKA